MSTRQAKSTRTLWLEAARSRWALRRAAGETRWRLAWHMASWLRLFLRQTQWLRSLDDSASLRRAARTDPRLYERWHRPYISRHFDLDTRRQIVAAHYEFVLCHFPARLRDRILRGHDVRVATVPLESGASAHVHLRKPMRGDAGELALLLLTENKQTLACCVVTFAGREGLLIGSMQGAGPHTDGEATHAFIQGSHGLHPKDLLVSLVFELAAFYGLARIRVATGAARAAAHLPATGRDNSDAFWREYGGVPTTAGCQELPLTFAHVPCAPGRHSRREMRQRRESFRRDICAAFVETLRDSPRRYPSVVTLPFPAIREAGGVTAARPTPGQGKSLLVAGS
jgi:uncharacterized protein VirK/YbjX